MGIDSLSKDIGTATNVVTQVIRTNPVTTAIGAGVAGAGIGLAVSALSRKKTKKRSKRTPSSKHKKRKSKSRRRKYKYARTAGKHRDTSHKRIRMTKSGQPYIILASGKARFISKSSAQRSRKLKGGRY